MTDEDLIRIYETEGGVEFAAADDFVKTLVPATIIHNGKRLVHFSEHYKARERLFAYFNIAAEGELEYFTEAVAKSLRC